MDHVLGGIYCSTQNLFGTKKGNSKRNQQMVWVWEKISKLAAQNISVNAFLIKKKNLSKLQDRHS